MSPKRSVSKSSKSKPVETIKLVDLFAGIGGFHHGIERAAEENNTQVETLLVSEIDQFCREVYMKNFGCAVEGDIKKINFKSYRSKHKIKESADILTAGFPCQPFSNSGMKRGLSDPRGKFLGKIVECINEFKPKVFVLENVPGMQKNGGNLRESRMSFPPSQKIGLAMQSLERKLTTALSKKYEITWLELDSSKFGSAQVRRRIYIIGVQKSILRKKKSKLTELANSLNMKENCKKLIIDIADKSEQYDASLNFTDNQTKNLMRDIRKRKKPSYMNGMRRVGTAYLCPGGNVGQGYHAYGKAPTLTKVWARFLPIYFPAAGEVAVRPKHDDRNLMIGKSYGKGYFRRASVAEVMRLQGFLEEDFEPHSNDRIAYEQAGNAVNADVVAEIARLLLPILR